MTFPIPRWWPVILLAPIVLVAYARRSDNAPASPAAPTYAAVASGRVDVEGGLLQLAAPRDGAVARVNVHEGDVVLRGQVLGALDDTAARLAVHAGQAEVDQAAAKVAQLDGLLAAARRRAGRLAQAARDGAGDGQGADTAATEVTVLVSRRAAARAASVLARTRLAQARHEQTVLTMRAPADADVVRVAARPGASTSPRSGPLFVLLPHTAHIVRAELNVAYVDAVTPGMSSSVAMGNGSDESAWPAHVLRIGQLVGPSQLEDDPQLRTSTRTVECVLALDGKPPLRVGQRVMVRFGTPRDTATGS
jgi:multidrug efflux pump subunit AcrA (membrane-fusion protein)